MAVWPKTKEASALLRVYYQDDRTLQVIVPQHEFEKLMEHVVRVKDVLDLVFVILLAISTVMVVVSIVQSVQLRNRHLETMHYLGCSRSKVRILLLSELSIVTAMAMLACVFFVFLLDAAAPSLMTIL